MVCLNSIQKRGLDLRAVIFWPNVWIAVDNDYNRMTDRKKSGLNKFKTVQMRIWLEIRKKCRVFKKSKIYINSFVNNRWPKWIFRWNRSMNWSNLFLQVRNTFRSPNWKSHHEAWKNLRYEWLPLWPKHLGADIQRSHLDKLKVPITF